jgi:tetratricopeptide (TPR) repeat protein
MMGVATSLQPPFYWEGMMFASRSPQPRRSFLRCSGLFILVSLLLFGSSSIARGVLWQGNFVIFGRVNLPNGRPATTRMKVFIEGMNGLKRDTLSDQDGNYEFRGMSAGRYRVHAINPDVPEQYCDPILADTNRAYSNRLQVDVNLRLPLHEDKKDAKPGTVGVSEAAQNIPKPARKAYEQGLKLQKENRAEQALIAFNQAIELHPEYFQALTERANLMMQRNKLAEAEADFERALQINSKYPPALRGLGYCQIQQKKFPAALGNLEKAFSLEPNVPLTLLLLGYANLSLDRYEEAKQCLQQALKIGPESAARARVYLAEVFAHEQKFKEAADEIRAYLKSKPGAPDAAHLQKLEADWRARSKAPKTQP